jgi:hypothetical protein
MFTPRYVKGSSSKSDAIQEQLASLAKRKKFRVRGVEASTDSIKIAEEETRSKRAITGFRSLTQVCRTIRCEVLPLYMSKIMYRVCHVDLQNYLDMVLLPECRQAGERRVPLPTGDCIDTRAYWDAIQREALLHRRQTNRILLVDCKSWEEKVGLCVPNGPRPQRSPDTTVDILPFLKFCATAPGIRVECGINACKCCENDWMGLKDILDALFEAGKRPKLAAWLNDAVSSIELQWPPSLSIVMGKGHGKVWMGAFSDNRAVGLYGMEDWAKELLGLELEWQSSGSLSFQCHKADWDLNWGTDEIAETVLEDEVDAFFGRTYSPHGLIKNIRKKPVKGKQKLERTGRGHGQHR